jgi:hypothetical protein
VAVGLRHHHALRMPDLSQHETNRGVPVSPSTANICIPAGLGRVQTEGWSLSPLSVVLNALRGPFLLLFSLVAPGLQAAPTFGAAPVRSDRGLGWRTRRAAQYRERRCDPGGVRSTRTATTDVDGRFALRRPPGRRGTSCAWGQTDSRLQRSASGFLAARR